MTIPYHHTVAQVRIGPLSNIAQQTQPGWAGNWTAEEFWALATRHPGEGSFVDAMWSKDLGALTLEPNFSWSGMTAASYTALVGTTEISGDINGYGTHVWFGKASETMVTIRSRALLGQDPTVFLSMMRYPATVNARSAARWRFTFGGELGQGFTLTWSLLQPPTLTEPDGTVHTWEIEGEELDAMNGTLQLIWQIYVVGERLIIKNNAIGRYWTIYNRDGVRWQIPPHVWRVDSEAQLCAWNVQSPRYATAGTITTDYVDLASPRDPADLHYRLFPSPAANQSASRPSYTLAAEVNLIPNLTGQRFTISMAGNGRVTPYIQYAQAWYPPTYADATDEWFDVSMWVKSASVTSEERLGPRTAQVTLELQHEEYDLLTGSTNIWEALGDRLEGLHTIEITMGYYYEDGSNDLRTVFTGVLDGRNISTDLHTGTMTLQATDKWYLLEHTKATSAPCVADALVSDALALLAQFAGIAPNDMDITPVLRDTTDGPQRRAGYAPPAWVPEFGGSLADMMRQICERRGAWMTFGGDGTLYIGPRDRSITVVGSYSTFPGTDSREALTTVTVQAPLGDAITGVMVRGRMDNRRQTPIYYEITDPNAGTAGRETYTGTPQYTVIADDNLRTPAEVQLACAEAYRWRTPTGVPSVRLTAPYALWDRQPSEYVEIYALADLGDVTRAGWITSHTLEWSGVYRPLAATATVLLEDLP
jgi:hypothetical protein